MKKNEPIKKCFYLPNYAPLFKQASFKTDHAYFSKLCLLQWIILLKNNISEFFRIQTFAVELNESIKTISCVTDYEPLLGQVNFKIKLAHFWKLCLLKQALLIKQKHF